MRRSLPLALLLLAFSAIPVAAGSNQSIQVHHGFHMHHNHFNHFRFHTGFPFGNGFFASPFVGWGDWSDWSGPPMVAGAPASVIVLNLGAPAAPATAAAAPVPAVETTHGVTIVRGPGTHHLLR